MHIRDIDLETTTPAQSWQLAADDEIPVRFDSACDDFQVVCSNGFVGGLNLETVFLHKPRRWPQCFPDGAEGNCSCTILVVRRKNSAHG